MKISNKGILYKFHTYLRDQRISIGKYFPKTGFGLIFDFLWYFFIKLPAVVLFGSFVIYTLILAPIALLIDRYNFSKDANIIGDLYSVHFGLFGTLIDIILICAISLAVWFFVSEEVRKNPKLLVALELNDD